MDQFKLRTDKLFRDLQLKVEYFTIKGEPETHTLYVIYEHRYLPISFADRFEKRATDGKINHIECAELVKKVTDTVWMAGIYSIAKYLPKPEGFVCTPAWDNEKEKWYVRDKNMNIIYSQDNGVFI